VLTLIAPAEKLREIHEEAGEKKLFGLETSLTDEERDDRQLEGFISKVAHCPGVELRANLKSIFRRCFLREAASEWELTEETVHLPLSCLQGGPSQKAAYMSGLSAPKWPHVSVGRVDQVSFCCRHPHRAPPTCRVCKTTLQVLPSPRACMVSLVAPGQPKPLWRDRMPAVVAFVFMPLCCRGDVADSHHGFCHGRACRKRVSVQNSLVMKSTPRILSHHQ